MKAKENLMLCGFYWPPCVCVQVLRLCTPLWVDKLITLGVCVCVYLCTRGFWVVWCLWSPNGVWSVCLRAPRSMFNAWRAGTNLLIEFWVGEKRQQKRGRKEGEQDGKILWSAVKKSYTFLEDKEAREDRNDFCFWGCLSYMLGWHYCGLSLPQTHTLGILCACVCRVADRQLWKPAGRL